MTHSPARDVWNQRFKRVRLAMEMSRSDVVECMRIGGIPVSGSRADGWMRSQADTSRRTLMTEPEFDAFLTGLVEWSKSPQTRG